MNFSDEGQPPEYLDPEFLDAALSLPLPMTLQLIDLTILYYIIL